jgi:Uncharacterized conserved protein
MRKALADKVMILGVDGLDPRLTKKYIEEGKMPNVKKILDIGAAREDLVLLGGHPTVTPSMWTTLSTGCYANVHSITGFNRKIKDELDAIGYNLDSRMCKAEQLWNVCVEAGKKTLVFHWPGCSWPPTSDSSNLYVIDGSAPGNVAGAVAQVEGDFVVGASASIDELKFMRGAADDAIAPCIIRDAPVNLDDDAPDITKTKAAKKVMYIMEGNEGMGIRDSLTIPLDLVQSPITDANGWAEDLAADAKEFIILFSGGLIRRYGLILKNEKGIYDHVALYKSKKDKEPIAVLYAGKLTTSIIDEAYKKDVKYQCNRSMKILDMKEDGSELKIYVSPAMNINEKSIYSPVRIFDGLTSNVGYAPPTICLYVQDKKLTQVQLDCWYDVAEWQSKAIHYLIDTEGIEMVFSHYHAVDQQAHTFIRYMTDKGYNKFEPEVYRKYMEDVYVQTDYYIGKFLHYLDEGWTILVVSDHALVCPAHRGPMLGDMMGSVNVRLMEELGYTVLQRDENGNEMRQCDWSKTRAVATQANDIYLNLKGRYPYGIVDPEDKYELEEQIITDLYGYKDPDTGKRVVALALHNKDAVLLGYGGPECGDICYWIAEGYNYDHTDSLSTTLGEADTSVSPIFIAAGKGIKPGITDRIIREVDVAPTVAVLAGVRMPKQCEGAPVYQILAEE